MKTGPSSSLSPCSACSQSPDSDDSAESDDLRDELATSRGGMMRVEKDVKLDLDSWERSIVSLSIICAQLWAHDREVRE
jgi:hypothetical protein